MFGTFRPVSENKAAHRAKSSQPTSNGANIASARAAKPLVSVTGLRGELSGESRRTAINCVASRVRWRVCGGAEMKRFQFEKFVVGIGWALANLWHSDC